jgi:uncharacterized membrane protein YdbT with pleckstrin-like domain
MQPPETNPAPAVPTITFTPSLHTRFGVLLLCFLFAPLIIPAAIGVWIILTIRHTRYEITGERLLLTTGVLTRTTSNLELYRITDLTLSQSLFDRIVGIGNIQIISTDRTCPTLPIRGIRDHRAIADAIRDRTEQLRHRRGQREFDIV